jgi:hypothetical protein
MRNRKKSYLYSMSMALISLLLFGNAETAGATYFTTSMLKEKLESADPVDTLSGMSYIAGVFDGFDLGTISQPSSKHLVYFCLPVGTTLEQIVAVVKKYILDNPKDWQTSANTQVTLAIMKAWPCKK